MKLNSINLNNNFNNSNKFSKINFQKKLIATTKPVENKENGKENSRNTSQYKFYKLEPEKDRDYFTNAINDWQDGILILETLDEFQDHPKYYDFYVIEDNKKHCLGYAQVNSKRGDEVELINLETKPSLAHRNNDGKSHYIGETMLSFLMGLTNKNPQKNNFTVPVALSDAQKFYVKKCGFHHYENGKILSVYKPKEEFDGLIAQNEQHTGKKIEFLI